MYINYRVIKVFDNDILFLYIVYKYILYTNPLFSPTHSHNCSQKMCHHWNLGNGKK